MIESRLPPLTALRYFHAVGQTTSLRKAAAELNVSHTAVAKQIKLLEDWFGSRLVDTGLGGTVLNAQGRRLHEAVQEAFGTIARAAAEIRPPGQLRELRITAPPGFATFWILPRLQEIQAQLPTVAIHITPFEATGFDRKAVDIQIMFGELLEPDLINIELVRPAFVALASHAWCEAHPEVKRASDLLPLSLVHERLPDVWNDWFQALGLQPQGLRGPRVGNLTTVLEAVHLHQGPGLFADLFIEDTLLRGRLQQVVPETAAIGTYMLITTREKIQDEAVRRFIQWLEHTLMPARGHGAALRPL